MKHNKVWLNKKFIDSEKSAVHLLTHTFHYGSGAFEGIRFYKTKKGPAVFRLDDHIKRLFYSASVLGMKLPYSKKEIKEAIFKLIKLNKIDEGYIRPIAFYGSKMGLNPKGASVNLAIAVVPWGAYLGDKPVKTIISKFIRLHSKSIIPDAKICGYYANSVFASLEAKKRGVNEAIFLDHKGKIAEGPGENIFLVKKDQVFTPKTGSILPGITRDTIIVLLKDSKIKIKEKEISPKELKSADELFFVGTAAEVCPIGKIDSVLINRGKIGSLTKILQDSYKRIVRGEEKKYLSWLTFIN